MSVPTLNLTTTILTMISCRSRLSAKSCALEMWLISTSRWQHADVFVPTCRCICNNIIVVFVATCRWQSWAKLGNICKMIIIHSFCVNYLGKGFFRCQEQSQPIFRGSFFVYLFVSPKFRFPNIQFTLDLKIYSMEWLGKQFLDWQAPLKWHWVNREWWDVKQSYVSIIKWLNNHIYQLSSD